MPPPQSLHDGSAQPGADSGAASHAAAPAARRTLPPPEWLGNEGARSAGSVALERFELDQPIARRSGPKAETAALRARLLATTQAGDDANERAVAMALARALATRGTELELATKLSRRALLLGDDPALLERRDQLVDRRSVTRSDLEGADQVFERCGAVVEGFASRAPAGRRRVAPRRARRLVRDDGRVGAGSGDASTDGCRPTR